MGTNKAQKTKVEPRNKKLAKLSLRWLPDLKMYALLCGSAVLEAASSLDLAKKSARDEQEWQWDNWRIATELQIFNRDGTPASGPGSRSTFPRSRDPRSSRG
jgi:hypothetical protein